MPICKAGIFPSGLISRYSSVCPLPPIVLSSTDFTTYSIPFKFSAIRTRHAHELRQNEYNTGCTIEAVILLKKKGKRDRQLKNWLFRRRKNWSNWKATNWSTFLRIKTNTCKNYSNIGLCITHFFWIIYWKNKAMLPFIYAIIDVWLLCINFRFYFHKFQAAVKWLWQQLTFSNKISSSREQKINCNNL